MTEIKFTRLEDGKISVEMEGDIIDISVMICEAMVGNPEIAALIHGAIPTFLDATNVDRDAWCQQMINSQGLKGNPNS